MVTIENLEAAIDFCHKIFHIKQTPPKIELIPLKGFNITGVYFNSLNKIVLDSDRELDRVISTLFHEYVHVHQYRSKKLQFDKSFNWRGKIYTDNNWDSPWEQNARSMSQKMFKKYFKI